MQCFCVAITDREAYSFTTDGYGIFNVRTNLGACRTHERVGVGGGGGRGGRGGSSTNKFAQKLSRRDKKKMFLAMSGKGMKCKVFGCGAVVSLRIVHDDC